MTSTSFALRKVERSAQIAKRKREENGVLTRRISTPSVPSNLSVPGSQRRYHAHEMPSPYKGASNAFKEILYLADMRVKVIKDKENASSRPCHPSINFGLTARLLTPPDG
jgi:hypothetical protein